MKQQFPQVYIVKCWNTQCPNKDVGGFALKQNQTDLVFFCDEKCRDQWHDFRLKSFSDKVRAKIEADEILDSIDKIEFYVSYDEFKSIE